MIFLRTPNLIKALLLTIVFALACPFAAFANNSALQEIFGFVNQPTCSRLVSSPSPSVNATLTQLKDLRDSIANEFPPTDFQIIGIGQSPSWLIASLQAQREDYAFNLPLSNFRPLFRINDAVINADIKFPLPQVMSSEEELRLYDQFDKFIPPSDKPLLLVDYSTTGATLVSVYYFLAKYLKELGTDRKIHVLVLTSKESSRDVFKRMEIDLKRIGYFKRNNNFFSRRLEGPLASVISNQDDDYTISEFGRFPLRSPPAKIERSERYDALVDFLHSL